MAIEIATAFVQVVPSMKGVGKAIESAFGSASETAGNTAGIKAGNGFAGGFGAKLGVITGIAQSVAGKAIEAFMGLSGEITSASDSAQKFASTLNFAGVSERQIKRLTASTQDYADKTVYDLNDIRNTTAQLAANGVPNYDRLAEAAGNLNAVAGGSADTFKSVAMVLTQTAGQGKLTTENWNQLSDAIPGASGKIQQALKEAGAYTGNFRDAMADGQITAQEFNDAIMSLGFTDAAVEAATSASTIEGATGNLEAAFVKLGASVLDTAKPAITGGMSWIADGVTNAVPVVQAGIEGLIGWFQRLYSKLEENGAITAFKSAWDTIRDAIMGVVNMVIDWAHMIPPDGLANGIKLVADTLNWFVRHGKELAPIIIGIGTAFAAVKGYQALNSGLQALTGTMNTVTTAAKGVSNGIMLMTDLGGPVAMLKQMAGGLSLVKTAQTAWSTATKMATAVQGAFNAVIAANPIGAIAVGVAAFVAALAWFFTQTEAGRKAWAAFTSFLSSAWQSVVSFVTSLGQNIANFFTQTIPNAIQSVIQWFQQLPSAIGTALSNLITSIGTWAVSFGQSALQAGQQFVSNIANFLTNLPATIAYWLAYGITFVVLWAAQLGSQAISAGQQFLANLGTFFVQLPGNIWNWLTSTVASVASWAAQMGANALSAGSRFLSNVGTFISQLPANVGSWLSGAVSAAASFVGRMASNAVNAGSRFLSSIGSYISQVPGRIGAGLSGAISAVGSFASSMASGALRAGQQFLSNLVNTLASIPGRMVSIGSQIVHGIISGITGSIGKVGSAILGGVKDAISGVKNFLGIHSPSRLFRDQIGRNIGLGLAQGISNSQAAVMSSMNGMASDIASTRFTTPDVATGYGLSPTRASVSTGGEPLSGELLGELLSELRALHADMPLIMEKLGIEVDGRELGRVIRNAIA